MKKALKKFCVTILSLVSIALFVFFAFLFKDAVCLNGSKSYKINEKEIPIWIKEKVSRELEQFKQIDKSTFDAFDKLILENKIPYLAHFKISNNKVFGIIKKQCSRYKSIKAALEKILETNKIGDSEFIIYLWDGVHYGQSRSFLLKEFENLGIDINKIPPIFAFAANKVAEDRKSFVLFPDSSIIDPSMFNKYGWDCLSGKISAINSKSPWDKKQTIAFWRGGNAFSHREYQKRDFAVKLSREHPELLDAKYAPPVGEKKTFWNRRFKYVYKIFNVEPWASFARFIDHKMILDLEGNTVSWQGIYWKLFSNSVVLKQVVNNEIWVSDQFIPWLHFVPIKEDLTDLIEKINWVKEHDAHAKQIAATSTDFMKKNLMPKHFDMYIYCLLNEYSKRFNVKYNIEHFL